jgi:4-carboxymuconolactone decarboxylase
METGEVPNRGLGRLEAYWTGVLERVKKQSEARHSKEGAAAWCEDPLSRDDSAIDADKEQRFPLLKLEQLNDQQRPFADEILKVSSIGISGPFNMMLRSPVMGQRMFAMLDYLRFNTSVPRKLNEFAILIQARLWTSQVAWTAHYPLALKAGLPQAVADDLKVGKRPASMQPDEAAVYDLCMDLAKDHVVSDATFKKARELFSDQQIVDLITVSGVYITLAMLSNTAEDATPGGKTPPLQPLPAR